MQMTLSLCMQTRTMPTSLCSPYKRRKCYSNGRGESTHSRGYKTWKKTKALLPLPIYPVSRVSENDVNNVALFDALAYGVYQIGFTDEFDNLIKLIN